MPKSSQALYATCPLDCPSCCALAVQTENGKLTSISGWPEHPNTQGIVCTKLRRFVEVQQGERVTTPLLRTGRKGEANFREVSWETALDHIATRLTGIQKEHGGQAIYPYYYGGTLGLIQQRAVERLGNRLGYSTMGRSICFAIAAAGWQAGVGKMVGPNPQDVAQSDLVVLWGINAVSTNLSFMHHVKKARQQGAQLVVVDPYRNRTAALADNHLNPRPGTDGALACGVMQVLLEEGFADSTYLSGRTDFDENLRSHLLQCTPQWAGSITGLEPDRIRQFARAFGAAQRPFIRLGVGMTRQKNGAVNVHAASCLPAVTGAWQRGGGALLGTDAGFAIDDSAVRCPQWQQQGRTLDMCQLGLHLTSQLQPPVAALLVFNSNPAVTCPDLQLVHQGLSREDLFTVVHEIVLSDTARFADVVLPATTFLEHSDIYRSYGQYTFQYSPKILEATGQARCNHDVVNDLARRLGCQEAQFQQSHEQMIAKVLLDSGLPNIQQMEQQHWVDMTPKQQVTHFTEGFFTDDRRFHFYPHWSDPEMPRWPDHWAVNQRDNPEIAGRYPLDFMTPPAHLVLNSTFTQTKTARQKHRPLLLLNPDDAATRGVTDGDMVRVYNDRAGLSMVAELSDSVRPGLCLCESNHLSSAFPEKVSLNALVDSTPVAPAGGAAFHDVRVQVSRTVNTGDFSG